MFFQWIFKDKFLVTMYALKRFSSDWMTEHMPVQLVFCFGLVWALRTRKGSIAVIWNGMPFQFSQGFETLRTLWALFSIHHSSIAQFTMHHQFVSGQTFGLTIFATESRWLFFRRWRSVKLSQMRLESGFGKVSSMAHRTFEIFLAKMQFVM